MYAWDVVTASFVHDNWFKLLKIYQWDAQVHAFNFNALPIIQKKQMSEGDYNIHLR